jgi:hypothetical protein
MDPPVLTSGLNGEGLASRTGRCTPWEIAICALWLQGWADTEIRSDRCGEEMKLVPIVIQILAVQLAACRITD